MEERFKFPHVHAITGTFVIIVLAVGALWLSRWLHRRTAKP